MLNTNIATDCLAIVVLAVTVFLFSRNNIIKTYKIRYFYIAATATLLLLLLEIMSELLGTSSNPNLVPFHVFVNVLGFSLTPVVPFAMTFLYDNKKTQRFGWAIFIPLIINTIMTFGSIWYGWIFTVNQNNQYSRGPYFLVQTIIGSFYFIVLIISESDNFIRYDEVEHILKMSIYILPMLGTALQIIFPRLLLIWSCISISLVLYYILISERQFKIDPITGVPNRIGFQKEMQKLIKAEGSLVVVFDLNNLKVINDKQGHTKGDEVIKAAAEIIDSSFIKYGSTYRIGGDEFCVICRCITEAELNVCINNLKALVEDFNKEGTENLEIACGYSYYNSLRMDTIYDAFKNADQAMYEEKNKLKMA